MKGITGFSLFSFLFSLSASAQEMVLVVERCKALDQTSPIHNIWTDEENIKWVANRQGLHKVMALDLVQKVSVPAGVTHLLTIRGGNAQVEWNTAEMQRIIGNAAISSASYDGKTKTLWIGTAESGVYQFTLSPLKLVQQLNTSNSKLTSNRIHDIFIHPDGTVWIATDDGMLTGSSNRWILQERYLNFVGVDAWGSNMWILGDDFLWQVDSRGKWLPVAIELKNVEGKLRDIAVDNKGRVWIASNMMTGFNVEAGRYQRFGPGQYFTSQFVNCLDVDKDGTIWAGTDDKGLYLIQWEAAMTVNILTDASLDCKSKAPVAAISARVTGGEPPFAYAWNSGQATDKITGLGPGKYTITVTDGRGTVKAANYEIPDPTIRLSYELVKAATGATPGDGSVNLLVDGGSGVFTYKWDNGETQALATALSPGAHSVTVTDANGCSASLEVQVTEKITALSVALTKVEEIKCAGADNGAIKAGITGGKPPYRYAWSNGSALQEQLTGLPPGQYSVTVADAAGQTASALVTLAPPTPLAISAEMTAQSTVSMANGQAQVKAAGGVTPYAYTWDNGETTAGAKALSPGAHTVTVADAHGCTAVASVTVTENIAALGVIIRQTGQVNCHGQATVSLAPDITGGKGPYTYVWSNGSTAVSLENTGAGTYAVTVTDVTGSGFSASAVVTQPERLAVTVSVDASASVGGQDGKATVKAGGGTGAYRYAWDNGETTAKAAKLVAGLRTITVTDAAGCTTSASVEITENILALEVVLEQTSAVTCAGGADASLRATVKGGKGPYAYQWSDPKSNGPSLEDIGFGSYTLLVTDATGKSVSRDIAVTEPQPLVAEVVSVTPASTGNADGSVKLRASGGSAGYTLDGKVWPAGAKEFTIDRLKPGATKLVVKDAAGCTAEVTVDITEDIHPLSVQIRQTSGIQCAGTSVAALETAVSGGKPPYTYAWNHGASSSVLSGLAAGAYAVEVRDASGLSGRAEFTVTGPAALTAEVVNLRAATNDRLRDGKGAVEAKGGTSPYTHAWSSGETASQALKLPAGQGSVTVTDANGCRVSVSFEVREKVLPELTADRLASGEPLRMEKIQFEADSVKIYPEAVPSLEELYDFLYDNPTVIIEVAGHTNSLPADDYCDRISAERAESVARYLTDKGIEARRIIAKGYGKRKPVATNQTPEGRRRNQRVEIRLIRIGE